jgi:alkanesulfonate monooxygenase SsuD/methylene tetrahydromethanopterin reductase-like flavin-dependent oxidoreductase (luciferase family)
MTTAAASWVREQSGGWLTWFPLGASKEGTVVELSVSVEGLFGLTWPAWKRLVLAVDDLGFAGLYLADHFVPPEPPDYPSPDLIVALAYAADHTERVRFGPLVAPLSYRDPVLLARQAAALDDLSGGRFVLGVGAGWMDREHEMFGYDLWDVPTRMARLEEGLAVVTGLLQSDAPVTFAGRFFRLQGAALPGPKRPGGPPVLVGASGPRLGLPLVARYADVWNAQQLTPEQVQERSDLLDGLLRAVGRPPADVRRTFNAPVVCGRTPAELEARVRGFRRFGGFAALTLDELLATLREWFVPIIGTPEEVVAQVRAYEAAGIAEVTLQWFDTDDVEGLEVLAAEVLPRLVPETA